MLSIILLTYNRPMYAEKTLKSVLRNLKYSGERHVHIADDGTPMPNYIQWLCDIAQDCGADHVTWSNAERSGYGGNYNLACQTAHRGATAVLPLEDDWELTREFNIDPIVAALDVFGCIRCGYVGYTQQLRGEFVSHGGYHWLKFDPDSPEPHIFAGHPRIETVEWARSVGPWPVGMDPGATEFAVAHRPAARQNVAWPVDLIPPSGGLFAHVGTIRSY